MDHIMMLSVLFHHDTSSKRVACSNSLVVSLLACGERESLQYLVFNEQLLTQSEKSLRVV